MPIVPTLNRQVQPDVATVPTPKLTQGNPEAFGTGVAAAGAKVGEQIKNIGEKEQNDILQQNQWMQQASLYNSKEDLRTKLQDSLYSTGTSTIKDAQGKQYQVSSGLLNRQGFNAQGATVDFDNQANAAKSQAMIQFKDSPAHIQAMAARQFDTVISSYRGQVAKHESAQVQSGVANTFLSSTINQVKDAGSATDVPSLQKNLDGITESYNRYGAFTGKDPETIQKNLEEWQGKAVQNAVNNKLVATGDIDQAKGMLVAFKNKMSQEQYDKIDSTLTTGMERLQKQAQVATVQKQISGQTDALMNLASGKASWMNVNDMANLVKTGQVSEKFAKAYTDVIAAEGNYNPSQKETENVPKFIDAIYNSKDQTQLHDTLISMMQEHKDMSQDEMAILINSAIKRSGTLPLDIRLGTEAKPDPKQQNIDAGARAVVTYGRRNALSSSEISDMYGNYYNNASNNVPVNQAIDMAQKQHALNQYPPSASMQTPPNMVISKDSPIRVIFPRKNTNARPK